MLLEKKIPPPIFAALFASIGWWLAKTFPIFHIELANVKLFVSLPFVVVGVFIAAYTVVQFFVNKTTVNPHTPEKSRVLVTNGFYHYSRNPMYLSMAIVLTGLMLYLSSVLALAMVPLFIVTINYLQIKPEETALEESFGEEYENYRQRVRRWM